MSRAFLMSITCLAAAVAVSAQEKDQGASRAELTREAETAFAAGDLERALERMYRAKFKNPEYVARKRARGVPREFKDFAEEKLIRRAIRGIALERQTPAGTDVRRIPVSKTAPRIDGKIEHMEWRGAYTCGLGDGSRLYLKSDGKRLFLACDARREFTEKGFDQFRFHIHVDLCKWIANERVHVDRYGRLTALRQTKIRPRRSSVTDWHVYAKARGATTLKRHRQYEAVLDMEESSLFAGVPFNARVEVETDPKRDARGKFKARAYLGRLGSRRKPVWFVIGRPSARAR